MKFEALEIRRKIEGYWKGNSNFIQGKDQTTNVKLSKQKSLY